MKDDNIHNVYYFENASMRGLFNDMDSWQRENKKRFLSTSIQQDGQRYCCICLTNPSEVIIVGPGGFEADVSSSHSLMVSTTD